MNKDSFNKSEKIIGLKTLRRLTDWARDISATSVVLIFLKFCTK